MLMLLQIAELMEKTQRTIGKAKHFIADVMHMWKDSSRASNTVRIRPMSPN